MNTMPDRLRLRTSPFRPDCQASEQVFCWTGPNTSPPATINNPLIQFLVRVASCASLSDPTSYGSGLHKFHVFCDAFHIPEEDRLPVSFEVLHSFAVWAASDPDILGGDLWRLGEFEPVSVQTVTGGKGRFTEPVNCE